MKRFRIKYRDEFDDGCPVFSCTVKGYDKEHAIDRFNDGPDAEGWVILEINEVKYGELSA